MYVLRIGQETEKKKWGDCTKKRGNAQIGKGPKKNKKNNWGQTSPYLRAPLPNLECVSLHQILVSFLADLSPQHPLFPQFAPFSPHFSIISALFLPFFLPPPLFRLSFSPPSPLPPFCPFFPFFPFSLSLFPGVFTRVAHS